MKNKVFNTYFLCIKNISLAYSKLLSVLNVLNKKNYSELIKELKLMPYKEGYLIWQLICQIKTRINFQDISKIYSLSFFLNPGKIKKKIEYKAKGRVGIIQDKRKHLYIRIIKIDGTKSKSK